MKYTYFVGRYIVSGRVPLDPSYTADAALPPQWTSIDTEHTYRFGKGRARAGFRELTLVYVAAFNGASAVNFQRGPKDSQEIVVRGTIIPEWTDGSASKRLRGWERQFFLHGR